MATFRKSQSRIFESRVETSSRRLTNYVVLSEDETERLTGFACILHDIAMHDKEFICMIVRDRGVNGKFCAGKDLNDAMLNSSVRRLIACF